LSGGAGGSPGELRALARRRLARIAIGYLVVTAVLVVVNVATHGPTWWYFAAGGVALAIAMQALRLRR
jgi:peptidoglycan/LPS O-acetylase OafA/YrhL